VLVVEDEAILALDLAQTVREMGHEVAGPFATVAEALPECSATAIGFAIIDFNLKGETTEALARALRAEGVAFVLVTGSPVDALPPELRDADPCEAAATARSGLRDRRGGRRPQLILSRPRGPGSRHPVRA
jgi:CheY-like chemotaxis protein